MNNDLLLSLFALLLGLFLLITRNKYKFKNDATLTNVRTVVWGIISLILGLSMLIKIILK
jgi:hypothetical protein